MVCCVRRIHRVLFLLGMLQFASACAADRSDCKALMSDARSAQEAGDIEGLKKLADQSLEVCRSSEQQERLRGTIAKLLMKRLLLHPDFIDKPANYEPQLQEVLSFGNLWRANALMGDIHEQRREFVDATMRYQQAIDALIEAVDQGEQVTAGVRETIYGKAELSRLAAAKYVGHTRNRAGEAGGLAAIPRGVKVRPVSLPVFFESDSTDFTVEGRKAAIELAELLKSRSEESFTLIGHCDERGTPEANQVLSENRARWLAKWLGEQGVKQRLETAGRGEDQPMQLDNPARYTQEQIWQINRRVELQFPGGTQ